MNSFLDRVMIPRQVPGSSTLQQKICPYQMSMLISNDMKCKRYRTPRSNSKDHVGRWTHSKTHYLMMKMDLTLQHKGEAQLHQRLHPLHLRRLPPAQETHRPRQGRHSPQHHGHVTRTQRFESPPLRHRLQEGPGEEGQGFWKRRQAGEAER